MTSVVLVDWLGRGGIAQTTEAWAIELVASGVDVIVVTRPAREIVAPAGRVVTAAERLSRIAAHRAVVDKAAEVIRDIAPDVVVVQNYVLAALERPVFRAARSAGSRVVVVVHDHVLHSRLAGSRRGLRGSLRTADAVVAHTRFVAGSLESWTGRTDVVTIPHPVPVGLLAHPSGPDVVGDVGVPFLATHFGVLKRGYKGTSTVVELARRGVPGWCFALLGVGAPNVPGVQVVPRFLEPGELTAAVSRSAAVLLPYRFATQSGAVVLAQTLGAVPVASAVGGIPEQIDDGATGRLVPRNADVDDWSRTLLEISDDEVRAQMAAAARDAVWSGHRRFVAMANELVGNDFRGGVR